MTGAGNLNAVTATDPVIVGALKACACTFIICVIAGITANIGFAIHTAAKTLVFIFHARSWDVFGKPLLANHSLGILGVRRTFVICAVILGNHKVAANDGMCITIRANLLEFVVIARFTDGAGFTALQTQLTLIDAVTCAANLCIGITCGTGNPVAVRITNLRCAAFALFVAFLAHLGNLNTLTSTLTNPPLVAWRQRRTHTVQTRLRHTITVTTQLR